jgi:hypothetical protein
MNVDIEALRQQAVAAYLDLLARRAAVASAEAALAEARWQATVDTLARASGIDRSTRTEYNPASGIFAPCGPS